MRRVTPRGCAPPWRSAPNVRAFTHALEQGITLEEILDLIDGASDLVVAGREPRKYWNPANLLGERTCEYWRQNIAQHRLEIFEAQERRAELEQIEKQDDVARRENLEADAPVRDLELHRLGKTILEQAAEKEDEQSNPLREVGR